MKKKLVFLLVLVSIMSMLYANGNAEQNDSVSIESWPNKPVNIIVTSSAGGDGDYLMRLLGKYLEKELGQSVVITNVSGGNGSIGMDDLMQHEPDGYTFYVNNTCALAANQANGLVDYDYTVSDPVCVFAKHSGEMIWVRTDSPYQTLEDLIEASKAEPGKITIGVSMGGSVYAAAMMLQNAGAQLSLIDASDGSERIIAVLGKQVDCAIAGYGIGKEYIESNDLRPLCTLMGSRSAALPDVPTAEEAGAEGLVINNLFVLLAPKGTDSAIIEKLNAIINKITSENTEYQEAVTKYSGQVAYALSIADTIEVLEETKTQFMNISHLLGK